MAASFTLYLIGPPPGTATAGADLWIDFGVIPVGYKVWIGKAQYTSPYKSITFELRTNLAGKSTGTLANTKILDTYAVAPKSGTLTRDLYKNGLLHITTVLGTGVEHWWLHLTTKTATAGAYYYSVYYAKE
jgi:hypothetical protein